MSVTAHGIISEVEKDSKDAMTGLSLQYTKASGCVRVTGIADGGLFAKAPVQVGHVVIAINGEPCPSKTKDAVHMINEAEGKVTLVTREYLSPEDIREIAAKELTAVAGAKKLSMTPTSSAPAEGEGVPPKKVESLLKSSE